MQDPSFVKFFFKTISSDGVQVTVLDMRKMLRESNLNESMAEEYVERTAGVAKAKYFTLDNLTEVLSGKARPQTYAE